MSESIRPSEQRSPKQFGLKRVFAVMTVVGIMFGIVHWIGPGPTLVCFIIVLVSAAAYTLPVRKPDKWVAAITGGVLSSGLIVTLLLPAVQSARTPARRSQRSNNLKQIGLGLQVYADVHGCFPPAYVADDNGRPMHSWRVLILPYIEQKVLFDQYDFAEPWDGPHNRLLANQTPICYRCPSDAPWPGVTTSYLAVAGEETIWPATGGTAWSQFCDGTSNTIAVVEVAGSGINWMEPRDLPFSALKKGVNSTSGLGVSSRHANAASVLFCDGHTSTIDATIPIGTLEALCTRSGNETIVGDY